MEQLTLYCFHLHLLSGEAALGPLIGNALPSDGEVTAVQKLAETDLALSTTNLWADRADPDPVAAGFKSWLVFGGSRPAVSIGRARVWAPGKVCP